MYHNKLVHLIVPPLLTKGNNLELPIRGNDITLLSRLDLLIQRVHRTFDAGLGRSMLIGSCTLLPSMAFEVAYLTQKASCFNAVSACLEGVIDEFEFHVEVVPLTLKAAALVIKLTIVFDLCKRVPALLVHHCFVECVEGWGWAYEEIVEPGGYWVSGI